VATKNILFVENDPSSAASYQALLAELGYGVMTVASSDEALAFLRSDAPVDLVLVSLDLQGARDGLETARHILTRHAVPVVFLSDPNQSDQLVSARELDHYGIVGRNASPAILESVLHTALRLSQAHRRLKNSEERLGALFEHLPTGVAVYEVVDDGADFVYKAFNAAAETITGIASETAIGARLLQLFPQFAATEIPAVYRRVWRTGVAAYVPPFRFNDGRRTHWREYRIARLPSGEIISLLDDVDDRMEAQEALKTSEERFTLAVEASTDGIWDWDIPTDQGYYSPGYYSMLGYKNQEFPWDYHVWVDMMHPDDRDHAVSVNFDCIEGRIEQFQLEFRMRHKDGSWRWILGRGKAVARDAEGRALRLAGTPTDITERKAAEQRVAALLKEKDLILREVHHRIKNNLATVRSLLSLQADNLQDTVCSDALREAAGRVYSMALLYNKLFTTDNYDTVSLADYIPDLAPRIIADFPGSERIRLDLRVADIVLGAKPLVNLGIILNELLTNAMKYAFVGRDAGTILVEIAALDGKIRCVVADDGVGLDLSAATKQQTGFGCTLIQALCDQLHGTIRMDGSKGLRVELEFPV